MVTHVFIKNGLMWLFSSSCRFRPNKQFHGAESVLDNAIVPQLCCINQQMHSIKYKKYNPWQVSNSYALWHHSAILRECTQSWQA